MRPVRLFLAALAVGSLATTVSAQTVRSASPIPPGYPVLGFGMSVAVSGNSVLIGRTGSVPGFPMPAAQTGAVHIFADRGGAWTEIGSISNDDAAVGDGFGGTLAVNGDWLVIGASGAGEAGAAYIFQRSGGDGWVQRAKVAGTGLDKGAGFGSAVAISDGLVLVGAPTHAGGIGAVLAYSRAADGSWSPAGRLDGTTAGDRFGAAIAFGGGHALVGAPGPAPGGIAGGGQPPRTGGIFTFLRSAGGTWSAATGMAPRDTSVKAFGGSILLDGTQAFVGAPSTDGGSGRVFALALGGDGVWQVVGTLQQGTIARPAGFGSSLARAGADLLVGAPATGGAAGAVHVMRQVDGAWTDVQQLSVPTVGLGTLFGLAVGGGDGLAAIGGPFSDFFEGTGYLFARGEDGTWTERGRVVDHTPGLQAITGNDRTCEEGKIELFACQDVDLVSFLPTSALGAKRGIMVSDIWGWTDPETDREFVLLGRFDGTSFVDISDPSNPVFLGDLPLHEGASPNIWRDIKVYQNHAFIVSDGAGPHGMQVFDLTQLRDVRGGPATFTETAHYDKIASAHNIVIDDQSGFAYTVGNSMGGETCGGALHMIDIRDPVHPTFAGCFADPATGRARTGYTHDAQCTVYRGPDSRYKGHQMCFNASETALGIADVTDKKNPKAVSSASYPNVGYSHQGWLSDDHRYFFLDDELDELAGTTSKTRTLVWDITNLEDPVLQTQFMGTTGASDHNLYVKGRYMYQSNYVAGLRVIDIADPARPVEVGSFDTMPYGENTPGFAGTWSNYPYFKSGVIAVSSMREGLFLVRYRPRNPVP